jgi:hypothetical protein
MILSGLFFMLKQNVILLKHKALNECNIDVTYSICKTFHFLGIILLEMR